jgi:threonine/homoserine/homoserine lactone efflux protein
MSVLALIAFTSALVVAAASPGPGIAAIVARVLSRGMNGAIAFTAGVAVGDIVWLSAAILGLAVIAQTFHVVFLIVKYLGAAYLLYLAWRLWTTPAATPTADLPLNGESRLRLFLAGLTVTLGNPKVMVFYLALLPALIDLHNVTIVEWTILSAVTLAVLACVFGAYIFLAARARRMFTSPRAMTRINKGSGVIMAGAAVAIATR